jgi:hypothetical protein
MIVAIALLHVYRRSFVEGEDIPQSKLSASSRTRKAVLSVITKCMTIWGLVLLGVYVIGINVKSSIPSVIPPTAASVAIALLILREIVKTYLTGPEFVTQKTPTYL